MSVDLYARFVTGLVDGLDGIHTPFQERYKNDPAGFAKDILGVDLWSKQKEIVEAVRENTQVTVPAAPDTGKTFVGACLALWLFNCYPYSKTIVTAAPPERQIRDLLFGEIRGLQKRGLARGIPLVGGQPQTMSIVAEEENWWIKGFTIPTSGTREERISKFHGHHGRGGTFAIIDEVTGVPPEISEAIDNCLSGAMIRKVLLFNPLSPVGIAYKSTRDPSYTTVRISAFDHPNVISGEDLIPGMVSRDRTEERINKWTRPFQSGDVGNIDLLTFEVPWTGERRVVVSPVFCYKVLGEFPWEAESALIPMGWIRRAHQNYKVVMDEARAAGLQFPADLPTPVCGLDVAEKGQDANAFATRYGNFLAPLVRWTGLNLPDTEERAARLYRKILPSALNVDAIGVGAGCPAHIRKKMVHDKPINAVPVKVSWSATRETEEFEFNRLRDQLFWAVRKWMENPNVCLPPDDELEADFLAFEYEEKRRGIVVTMKPKLRQRLLGRSPDGADAVMLTFFAGKRGKGSGEAGVKTMVLGRRGRVPHPSMRPRRLGG